MVAAPYLPTTHQDGISEIIAAATVNDIAAQVNTTATLLTALQLQLPPSQTQTVTQERQMATMPAEGDYRAINTAMSAVFAGGTYSMPVGIYRGTLTFPAGVTIKGFKSAYVCGSDNWTGGYSPVDGKTGNTWAANTPSAGYWRSSLTVTALANTAVWGDDTPAAGHYDTTTPGAAYLGQNREQVLLAAEDTTYAVALLKPTTGTQSLRSALRLLTGLPYLWDGMRRGSLLLQKVRAVLPT